MPAGRPPKPKYKIEFMIKKIYEYTNGTQIPILKECCFLNEWNYDYVLELQRDHPELSQSIRRLLYKKEFQLEKAMLVGSVAPSTGIFMLKQLGQKDNPEPIIVNNIVQDNSGGNRSEKLKYVDRETIAKLDDLYDEIDKQIEKAEHDGTTDTN